MKTIKQIFSAIFALALCVTAQAQSWNDAYGMGNPGDDAFFTGSAVLYGTQNATRSNYLYYVTSAAASGAPQVTSVAFWTDMTRPLIEVLAATNQTLVTSNGSAGATNIWVAATNGFDIGVVFAYRSANSDAYQLFTLTNTPATTNIQLATALTNAPAAGDIVYRLTRVQAVNPTFWYQSDNGTNLLNGTKTNYYVLPPSTFIAGRSGLPLVVGTFVTNPAAAWFNVSGQYVPKRVGIR